jgi:hypothetical protein
MAKKKANMAPYTVAASLFPNGITIASPTISVIRTDNLPFRFSMSTMGRLYTHRADENIFTFVIGKLISIKPLVGRTV